MNNTVKMLLNMTVIAVVSGILLAVVFRLADPLIQANRERELKESIFVVLPEAKDYDMLIEGEGKTRFIVYRGLDADGKPVGIAFKAEGNGYQGNIAIMVGLDLDYLKLKGITVLEQVETPGLGNRISEPEFEAQFRGVDIKPRIEYIKNRKPEKPNQIQSITGATISSRAVVQNINKAVTRVVATFTKGDVLTLDGVKPKTGKEKEEEKEKKKEGTDG